MLIPLSVAVISAPNAKLHTDIMTQGIKFCAQTIWQLQSILLQHFVQKNYLAVSRTPHLTERALRLAYVSALAQENMVYG